MQTVSLSAHFDGRQIVLDEPFFFEADAKLLVTVLPKRDREQEEWTQFSMRQLERAYGDDEPEYALDCVKEANPNYEIR